MHAVIDISSGAVKRYGDHDFTLDADFDPLTERQVPLSDEAVAPEGVPLSQLRVLDGMFRIALVRRAVIDTATGAVKRHGYCDFENDGSFDASTESQLVIASGMAAPSGTPLSLLRVIDGQLQAIQESLPELKAKRLKEIDLRTRALAVSGFTYRGLVFSTSETAQRNWHVLNSRKDTLSYPYRMAAADNSEIYQIADAAEMEAMFLTGLGTVESVVLGNTDAQTIWDQVKRTARPNAEQAVPSKSECRFCDLADCPDRFTAEIITGDAKELF